MTEDYNMDNTKEALPDNTEGKSKSLLFSLLQARKVRKNAARENEETEQETAVDNDFQKPSSLTVPNNILEFRREWHEDSSMDETEENYCSFLYSFDEMYTSEMTLCFQKFRYYAEEVRMERRSSDEPSPFDASAFIYVSEDRLRAWVLLVPPLNGGKDMTLDDLRGALKDDGVTYGIDDTLLEKLINQKAYFKLALAASGIPASQGEDGWIEEIIPHTAGTPFLEEKGGAVDYKNLNWIIPIKAGDVICRIHPALPGAEGTTVTGAPIKGVNGAKPVIPDGSNTQYKKDTQELVAKVDGQIFYENGKYKVNQMIIIDGDVDLSTGNLQITGNLRIRGNVREGFTVKATGDINIDGMAEGATIIAGRNIFVKNGMNGNSHGRMEAGGDIKCQYLENAVAIATGNMYASSIINSTVSCDGEIQACSGHGTIIGGSVMAFSLIKAKTIGNKMGHVTTLILGKTPHYLEEKKHLTEALEQAAKDAETVQAQIDKLHESDSASLDPAVLANLTKTLQLRIAVALAKENNLQKELNTLMDKESKIAASQVQAEYIFPVVQVTIGATTRIFSDMQRHCRIHKVEGEIHADSL